MSNSQITIFYSWQSDLPGNKTRNIIEDSIKDAVRLLRNTVEIEADRDTKGKYGSPDIAQTIFSKIDECDIFIADVSAVCQYETIDKNGNKKIKYMPNPNVMLELGYATKVVGWENVICILNSEYASPEDMPFDIASRRLTPYSLKDKSKGEVKRFIRDVIQETVENILEKGKRVKSGFANLRLECFSDGKFSSEVNKAQVSELHTFSKYRGSMINKCVERVNVIDTIKLELSEEMHEETEDDIQKKDSVKMKDGTLLKLIDNPFKVQKKYRLFIRDDDKEDIIRKCKRYLDIDISKKESFFNIGNLKEKTGIGLNKMLDGTESEKKKYKEINQLSYELQLIWLLDKYVTTFNDLLFIPLAIENISTIRDEDIDIYITVETDKVKVISPSKKLIASDMEELENIVIEEEMIKKLFLMFETSEISYDKDITYSIADAQAEFKTQLSAAGINGNPKYGPDDYEREISKYIQAPSNKNGSEFIFSIHSLRAKERKWIGPALLLKPLENQFDISYTIKSKYSDGTLSGKIRYYAGI